MALSAMLAATDPNRISFPKLGIELTVDSTAFTVFGFSVTWYGVLITVGMMLAMIYAFSRMRKFGLDSDRAIDGVIGGIIGGIIGARAYYVIFHWDSYAGDWKAIFNIRSGGLAIYGGIIGALLVGSIICKLRKVRLLPMFDLVSLGFLIGQCIGRWGNFMNHEAFGSNTDTIFGMTSGKISAWISANYPDGSVNPDLPVHPCFFYESMWCLLGFIILHIVSKKARKFDGQIFLMYVIWYGTGRFFIESLRTDSLYAGTLKASQIVAVISVSAALILLIIGFARTKRLGSDYQLYVNTEESKRLLAEADERNSKGSAKDDAEEESAPSILGDDAPDRESMSIDIDIPDETSADESADESAVGSAPEADAEESAEPKPEKTEEEINAEKDARIEALLNEIISKTKAESEAGQGTDKK